MGLIRFLLAITVLLAHTEPLFGFKFTGQVVAVESFFVISGFYMAFILNEKYVGLNNSYMLFITNRLMKLFPVYWLILGLTFLVSVLLGVKSHGSYWLYLQPFFENRNILDMSAVILIIFSNLFILFQDSLLFLGLDTSNGQFYFTVNFWNEQYPAYKFLIIPQAWSITLELMFYAVAPFIARKTNSLLLLLFALSLGLKLYLFNTGYSHDPWNYRFFPSELFFFLSGIIAYRIYKYIENKNISLNFLRSINIFLVLLIIFYDRISFQGQSILFYLIFALSIPFAFLSSKNLKWDYKIGELSYPIYLSHILVAYCIRKLNAVKDFFGEALMVIIVSVLLSVVLNWLVTYPLDRIRQRRLKHHFSAH